MPTFLDSITHPPHVTLSNSNYAKQSSIVRSILHYINDLGYPHRPQDRDIRPDWKEPTTGEDGKRALHPPEPHHPSHHEVSSPSFDVYENHAAFFLEGEFPGIAEKRDVFIEEIGPRTLAVSAKVPKFSPGEEWGANARSSQAEPDKYRDAGARPEELSTNGDTKISPAAEATFDVEQGMRGPGWEAEAEAADKARNEVGSSSWIAERHHGWLQRSFTFPAAVSFDGLQARLSNGLLRIMVPKLGHSDHETRRHAIQD